MSNSPAVQSPVNYTEIFKNDPNIVPISVFNNAAIFTEQQLEYLNYLAAGAILEKLQLSTELGNPTAFIREEAYLRGRIELLLELKINSASAFRGDLNATSSDQQ